ncbi:MAG: hypothetical protein E6J03_13630 [Chloroflexi bacterium]|nr:MAG: hypothetical protein E6J03_13630 [Chloroflexota bacterium]
MSAVLPWIGVAAGLALIVLTLSSVLVTMVVPRPGVSLLTRAVAGAVRRTVVLLVDRFEDYTARDRVWAFAAPVFLMTLLAVWIGLLMLGFGLVMWPGAGDRRRGVDPLPRLAGQLRGRGPAGLEELRSATAERRAARSDTGGPAPPTER